MVLLLNQVLRTNGLLLRCRIPGIKLSFRRSSPRPIRFLPRCPNDGTFTHPLLSCFVPHSPRLCRKYRTQEISKSSSWLEAFAARATHTSTMSATSMVGVYNFQQKVLRFLRDSASKNNIHNDISLVDDLIQRANSMAMEAHIMAHDSRVTATELFTHLHMLRRHSVLDSPTVALPQRDKDRLLVMSVGGNDLFGPDARKVHEWKLDTEEENFKLIARVFDERAQSDKSKKNLLHQTVVLPGRSGIDHHWMLLRGPNLRAPSTKNPGSPFGDLPSSPPTRPAREHNKGLKRPAETDLPLPLTGPIPGNRNSDAKTRSPKVPSPLAPLTEKDGGAEAVKAANRNEQLPVGGKLVHFKDTWTKLFPQHPETVWKVSQGILIAFDDVLPSLLRYPL